MKKILSPLIIMSLASIAICDAYASLDDTPQPKRSNSMMSVAPGIQHSKLPWVKKKQLREERDRAQEEKDLELEQLRAEKKEWEKAREQQQEAVVEAIAIPELEPFVPVTRMEFGDHQLTVLPENLAGEIHLRELVINNTHLRELPAALNNLVQLKTLDASENKIVQIVADLSQLKALDVLRLRNNSIKLSPEFKLPPSLRVLDISGNGLESFPDSIFDSNALEELDVSFNNFEFRENGMTFDRLTNLKRLYIGFNESSHLPNELSALVGLEKLDASGNNLTRLPEDIGRLTNLKVLRLARNLLNSLPDSFSELDKLEVLSLQRNQFQTFPEALLQLDRLKLLNLRLNGLTALPDDISFMESLVFLNLERNHIREIPLSLSHMPLKALALAGNNLPDQYYGVFAYGQMVWRGACTSSYNQTINILLVKGARVFVHKVSDKASLDEDGDLLFTLRKNKDKTE
jgi:Leucine-rich repeat (LRR) protein